MLNLIDMMEKYSVSCSKPCLINLLHLSDPTHLVSDNSIEELETPRQGFFTARKQVSDAMLDKDFSKGKTKDCEVSHNSVKEPSN